MEYMNIGKRIRRIVKIDEDDLAKVCHINWLVKKSKRNEYAYTIVRCSFGPPQYVYMHRLIMQAQPDEIVDHINFDGLDNRRSNLRLVGPLENAQNKRRQDGIYTSKYKGVNQSKSGKWIAKIGVNGEPRYIGAFNTELEAAAAYDRAAIKYFGEFAATNAKLLGSKSRFGSGTK